MITAEDPTPLSGLRVLISGGTTGIGRATAARLVAEGARVLIVGRHEDALKEGLEDVRKAAGNGGEAHGITGDQSEYADVARMFTEADTKLGGLDVYIGSAAVGAPPIGTIEPDDIEYVVRTNVTGYIYGAHEAMKRFKASGEGHLVFIGSMSADLREKNAEVYVATKAANQAFAESLRKSVSEEAIRVSLVEPGKVSSDLASEYMSVEEQKEKIESGEFLKAEDIAAAILYILSQPQRAVVTNIQIRPRKQAI